MKLITYRNMQKTADRSAGQLFISFLVLLRAFLASDDSSIVRDSKGHRGSLKTGRLLSLGSLSLWCLPLSESRLYQ